MNLNKDTRVDSARTPPVFIPPQKRPGQIPPRAPFPHGEKAGAFSDQKEKSGGAAGGGSGQNRPKSYGANTVKPVPRKLSESYLFLAGRSFSAKGTAAVIFSVIIFFLAAELVLWGNAGISVLLLCAIYEGFCLWYFYDANKKYPVKGILLGVMALVLATGFAISVNRSCYFITFPALVIALAAQTAVLGGAPCKNLFSWGFFVTLYKRLIDGPIAFLDFPFRVIFGKWRRKNRSGRFWLVLGGILCAVPFTVFLLWLFQKADFAFSMWLSRALQYLRLDPWHLFSDIFAGIIGGVFLGAVLLYCRGALDKKDEEPVPRRFIDPLFAVSFLAVINICVLVFTVSQFTYLFGGEKGNLPGEITYAEYARHGFFELALALVLIFIIAMGAMCLTKRTKLFTFVRLELLLLCAGGFAVLASAVKRMLLYIGVYGLSSKRFLTMWFMLTVGVCLLFLALRCIIGKLPLARLAGVAVSVMVLLLSLVPLDGFVARYNVNAYISGKIDAPEDYYYLESLSVSAIPALVDAYKISPGKDLARAIDRQISINEKRHPVWGWTLDQIAIKKSIDEFRNIKVQAY